MANITYEMEKLLAKLSQEQDSANKEMKNLPEGRISSVKRNGVDTFFRVDEKRTRKSINKDENMIRALARKKYLHKQLELLAANPYGHIAFLPLTAKTAGATASTGRAITCRRKRYIPLRKD